MNSVFRTPQNQESYEAYKAAGNLDRGCVLCARESVHEFEYWRIIENKFPYDRIAKIHHMILPKRHVVESDLSDEEIQELKDIKEKDLHKDYDFMIEATHRMKSIPAHFHLHLIVARDPGGI